MDAYCLTCFEPLAEGQTACSRGHRYQSAEAHLYWNRNPRWMVAEQLLKIAILWAAIGTTLWMRYGNEGRYLETHSVWTLLVPAIVAGVLWRVASMLTRHDEAFRPRLLGVVTGTTLAVWGAVRFLDGSGNALAWLSTGLGLVAWTVVVCELGESWKRTLTGGLLDEGPPPDLGRRRRVLRFVGLWRPPKPRPRFVPMPIVTRSVVRRVGSNRGYCLVCFAPMAEGERTCSQGHENRPEDLRVYWNRNPELVSQERFWKGVVLVLGVLGPIGVRLVVPGGVIGTGAGWFFLLPTAGAYGLWRCASKLTRHDYNFHPRYLWTSVGGLVAAVGFLVLSRSGGTGLSLMAFGGMFAAVSWYACVEADRWKRDLMEGRGPTRPRRFGTPAPPSGDPPPTSDEGR